MSRPLRLLLVFLGAVAVIALLFTVVFPWFDRTFVTDPVLGTTVVRAADRLARDRRWASV